MSKNSKNSSNRRSAFSNTYEETVEIIRNMKRATHEDLLPYRLHPDDPRCKDDRPQRPSTQYKCPKTGATLTMPDNMQEFLAYGPVKKENFWKLNPKWRPLDPLAIRENFVRIPHDHPGGELYHPPNDAWLPYEAKDWTECEPHYEESDNACKKCRNFPFTGCHWVNQKHPDKTGPVKKHLCNIQKCDYLKKKRFEWELGRNELYVQRREEKKRIEKQKETEKAQKKLIRKWKKEEEKEYLLDALDARNPDISPSVARVCLIFQEANRKQKFCY